jgi:imidazolonepropionase-like amidohydrolase
MPADGRPLTALSTETNEILLLWAARNARKALMSGVTTVRDCGDRDGLVFQLRRAIEKGLTKGPRIILSGPFITMTGGHAYQEGREVDGVEEMVKTAATAMGRLDEIGSIAVGKQADIIAVENDPCRDITALANPSLIMRAGRIYRH